MRDAKRSNRSVTNLDMASGPPNEATAGVIDDGAAVSVVRCGFAFLPRAVMQGFLPSVAVEQFDEFAASWDRLGDDRYMADGGRYRRRRHAAFSVGPNGVVRKPHQPHYQSRDYNSLNGGIERWFEPVESGIATGPTLQAIIDLADRTFTPLSGKPMADWHVEAHQFRIEAGLGSAGLPTPEGLHRDGVDWVLVMLVRRENVVEGVTKIHGLDRQEIGSFCLGEPFDTALVDDHRVYHAVTPVVPLDPARPAYRDVLVLTFRMS